MISLAIWATVFAAISSPLAYLAFPRIPYYEVVNLTLTDVALVSFFSSLEVSFTVKADVQVDNSNFVGAELHASRVHIFYPDWFGQLQYIGDGVDHYTRAQESERKQSCARLSGDFEAVNIQRSSNENNSTTLIPASFADEQKDLSTPVLFRARQSILANDNLIFIKKLKPKTYLNILWDTISSSGTLSVPASLIVHTKSPLPFTTSFICYNEIYLYSYPVQIFQGECEIDKIVAGWIDLEKASAEMRIKIDQRFLQSKTIFRSKRRNSTN